MTKTTMLTKESTVSTNLDEILTHSAEKAFKNWANKRYTK